MREELEISTLQGLSIKHSIPIEMLPILTGKGNLAIGTEEVAIMFGRRHTDVVKAFGEYSEYGARNCSI